MRLILLINLTYIWQRFCGVFVCFGYHCNDIDGEIGAHNVAKKAANKQHHRHIEPLRYLY